MGLEAPKIVELLARPQQDESRADLALVATGDSFARTLEQAPATFQIANVRRRSLLGVDEGIGERREPGLERMHLAIEVRTTLREARLAIRRATERGE
jgi:hypothetical protein